MTHGYLTFFGIILLGQATHAIGAKTHPCRPNPCFNGGHCFRVFNNTRTFQCRCRADYVGERCESADKSMSAIGVLCGDKHDSQTTMDFACPQGTVIAVEYAAYGLPSNESSAPCRKGATGGGTGSAGGPERPCAYEGTLNEVMNVCHLRSHCGLPPLKRMFANLTDRPCKSASIDSLAMEYRFRCQAVEPEPISYTSQMPPEDYSILRSSNFTSSLCPDHGDYYENGICYRVQFVEDRSKRKSWNDARAVCAAEGGDLAGPIDPALHERLSEKMRAVDEKRVKYFWIGARADPPTDSEAEIVARWASTSAALDYAPDGSKLDEGECLVYYVQPNRATATEHRSVWLAKSCSLYYNWICQYPVGVLGREQPSGDTTVFVEPETTAVAATTTVAPPSTRRPRPTTARPHRPTKMSPVNRYNRIRVTAAETQAASTTTSTTTTTTEATSIAVTTAQMWWTVPATTEMTTDSTTESTTEMTTETTTTTTAAATTESGPNRADGSENEESWRRTTRRPDIRVSPIANVHEKTTSSEASRIRIKVPSQGHERPVNVLFPPPDRPESPAETTVAPIFDLPTTTVDHGTSTTESTTVAAESSTTTRSTTTESSSEAAEPNGHRVTILGPGSCEPIRERGISWPTTAEGTIAEKPCPVGTEGKAKWECRRVNDQMRFFPAHPDLSDCRHMWLQEIQRQVQSGRYGIKIADDLQRYLTTSTQTIYGGDVKRTLHMMEELFGLQAKQLWEQSRDSDYENRFNEALKFTQFVGAIIDFLMSTENALAWQDIPLHDRMIDLSLLMSLVEENASFLSRFMMWDNTTKLNFTNYAMKVEVRTTSTRSGSGSGSATEYAGAGQPPNPFMPASGPETITTPSWTADPNSDAVGGSGSSDSEFSMQDDSMAQIVLPTKGVMAMASQAPDPYQSAAAAVIPAAAHRSLSDAAAASGFAQQPQQSESSQAQPDRLRLAYVVYTRNLNTLLQPPNFDLAQDRTMEESKRGGPGGLGWKKRTTVVNSRIIAAVVNDPQIKMPLPDGQNVTVTLKHLRTGSNVENPRCVYWNLEQHSWDTEGCDILNTTTDSTICTCNHLTSFAILMDITGELENQAVLHKNILKYLTMAGCALSAVCLTLSILVFTCFRSLWSVRNSVHRNLCFTLLVGELLFLFGIDETRNKDVCTAIAVVLHYVFLSAFMWMFMEGYQLYTMLVRVFEPPECSQLIGYYVASYGAPAVVVAVSVGLARQHYASGDYCWINAGSPLVWSFVGPVCVITLVNMIFLAVALKVACGVKTAENRSKAEKIKGWLKGSTMLLCLLGLTWVFGFFFVIRPAILYFAYIFTIMNSLQGVFIFTFHVLLNEKVHGVMAKWFKRRHGHFLANYYSVNNTTKSGSSSNESRQWPTHLTASTAASYGFASGQGASPSMVGVHNKDQREMMERRANGGATTAECRRRVAQESDRGGAAPNTRYAMGQRRDGYLAGGEDDARKYSNGAIMPVQIIHRTFDDDTPTRPPRQQQQQPIDDGKARFPIIVNPSESHNGNGLRHLLYISTDDRNPDRSYPVDSRMNRFYYNTESNAAAAPPPAKGSAKPQRLIERF